MFFILQKNDYNLAQNRLFECTFICLNIDNYMKKGHMQCPNWDEHLDRPTVKAGYHSNTYRLLVLYFSFLMCRNGSTCRFDTCSTKLGANALFLRVASLWRQRWLPFQVHMPKPKMTAKTPTGETQVCLIHWQCLTRSH